MIDLYGKSKRFVWFKPSSETNVGNFIEYTINKRTTYTFIFFVPSWYLTISACVCVFLISGAVKVNYKCVPL